MVYVSLSTTDLASIQQVRGQSRSVRSPHQQVMLARMTLMTAYQGNPVGARVTVTTTCSVMSVMESFAGEEEGSFAQRSA